MPAQFRWPDLLHSWSRHILATGDDRDILPAQGIDEQNPWIGYPGAGEEQVVQAEVRLKTRLPESYREFLKVSNGWPAGGPYVARILPVEEIEWVSERKRDWLEGWKLGVRLGSGRDDPSVFSEMLGFDLRLLESGLEISDEGDIGVYLLIPGLKSADGEWEAWCFEAEGGAMRYRSFSELMQAEYQEVKDGAEEEHARSVRLSGGMKASLPSLHAEFQKEIARQSRVASSASWIDWPNVQYARGIIEVLEYGELRVRQIQEQAHDLEEVRPALEALAAELENRWQQAGQAAKQKGQDMLEQMRLYSTVEGFRQAMGILQQFLKEYKVL